MTRQEALKVEYGARIRDVRTGDELKFVRYDPADSHYVICDDGHITIWLTPDRLEFIKD